MNTTVRSGSHLDTLTEGLAPRWGWFVVLGATLLALGVIACAHLFIASLASVLYIGAMMFIGGIGQIVLSVRVRKSGWFFFWSLSGLLYTGAGLMAFYNPLLAAQVLTLFLATAIALSGCIRIAVGFGTRPADGWGWLVVSGVLGLIAGMIIFMGWPVNSLLLLGLLLAFDLIFQGVGALVFGLALKLHGPHDFHATPAS